MKENKQRGLNRIFLDSMGELRDGVLYVNEKRYRRCAYRYLDGDKRNQCGRYDTKWDRDLWCLCHKHAIEIGYSEGDWDSFIPVEYLKETK